MDTRVVYLEPGKIALKTARHFSGYSSPVAMLGMAAGPLFSGAMFDQSCDYRISFLILAGVAALGSAAALLAKQPSLAVKGGGLDHI